MICSKTIGTIGFSLTFPFDNYIISLKKINCKNNLTSNFGKIFRRITSNLQNKRKNFLKILGNFFNILKEETKTFYNFT